MNGLPTRRTAADEKHALFADERSDFVGVLNLWRASREPAAGGNRVLRHWCREHFLSFLRMREWGDLREQLEDMSRALTQGSRDKPAASTAVLHQTLLTGFLGGIGVLDEARTLPRRAGYAVRHRSRHAARQAFAALDRRREPGRNAPALCAHGGAGAAVVDRVGRRAPGQAHLRRRRMGRAARHGVRARDGLALWPRAQQRPARQLCVGRPDGGAADVRGGGARAPPAVDAVRLPRSQHRHCAHGSSASNRCLRRRDLLAGEDALVRFYLERIPPAMASTRAFDKWWRTEERGEAAPARCGRAGVPGAAAAGGAGERLPGDTRCARQCPAAALPFRCDCRRRWRHARRAAATAAGRSTHSVSNG